MSLPDWVGYISPAVALVSAGFAAESWRRAQRAERSAERAEQDAEARNSAFFEVRPGKYRRLENQTRFEIVNVGAGGAYNVEITPLFDPRKVWYNGSAFPWTTIAKGSSETFHFLLSVSDWNKLRWGFKTEVGPAEVTWISQTGKPRTQMVDLPSIPSACEDPDTYESFLQ